MNDLINLIGFNFGTISFSHAMAEHRFHAKQRKHHPRPSCLQTVNNLLTFFVRTSGKLDDT